MKCLETRIRAHGLKWRRYQDDTGRRFNTVEVPAALWVSLAGRGQARDRISQYLRARDRDELRRKLVAKMLAGEKTVALSHEFNVPVRTLNHWHRKARNTE